MSNHLREFMFENPPKSISYLEGEPLKLTEKFVFFHNKNTMRKSLNKLQYLFKSYIKTPLLASGIRDSYLTAENTDEFLILLFTTPDIVKKANKIIEKYSEIKITKENFFLASTQEYMLLLAKDITVINSGIVYMEEIVKQVLDDYFNKKDFEEFIKIRQFILSNY